MRRRSCHDCQECNIKLVGLGTNKGSLLIRVLSCQLGQNLLFFSLQFHVLARQCTTWQICYAWPSTCTVQLVPLIVQSCTLYRIPNEKSKIISPSLLVSTSSLQPLLSIPFLTYLLRFLTCHFSRQPSQGQDQATHETEL